MIEIKSAEDVEALWAAGVRPELVEVVVKTLSDILAAYGDIDAEWDPDAEGYIVLLEPGDDVENMPEIGLHPEHRGMVGIPKEYAERCEQAGAYLVVACVSNSWGWSYILPDEVVIPQELCRELATMAFQEGWRVSSWPESAGRETAPPGKASAPDAG